MLIPEMVQQTLCLKGQNVTSVPVLSARFEASDKVCFIICVPYIIVYRKILVCVSVPVKATETGKGQMWLPFWI